MGDLPYQRERRLLATLSGGRQAPTIGVSAGIPEITPFDVSAAVAGIVRRTKGIERIPDYFAQNIILYLWADDKTKKDDVVRSLIAHASRWAAEEKWRGRKGWLRAMCRVALMEHANRKVCSDCDATGLSWSPGYSRLIESHADGPGGPTRIIRHWTPGSHKACRSCSGRGVFPWSLRDRAEVITTLHSEIHWNSWRECWDKRYLRILSLVDRTEHRGLKELRKKLASRESF